MTDLKQFAQSARRQLREQVAARLEQVLSTDSVEIREQAKAVEALQGEIKRTGRGEVIERVAYTWFNRFCALRFMDANHYTRVGIVSPVAGFTQPEILQEAKQGLIDDSFPVDRQRILALLGGQTPAAHPQGEAYRLLLVGACNAYHKLMPFLFEPIEDYTELLMPTDLLSEQSILHAIREALTPERCRDVEVIGWLYQFYISERKDEVIGSKAKIQPKDIPAATQLFTPHWIVRYLVENSLGRLWLLNRPHSRLAEGMDYYIADSSEQVAGSSEQAASGEQVAGSSKQIADSSLPATGYRLPANSYPLTAISSPEAIKICDPACGSGHMLTYAFDLLYQIYEEEGYDPVQIPRLILEKNLYGIEIDKRAGDLAAFALTMKARAKDRRFFRRGVTPNICILENIHFTETELDDYMEAVGRDLFTADFEATLTQFEQADNFGSLIRPQVKDIETIRERLAEKGIFENLFLHATHRKVQQVLTQAEYLCSCYHVVVANPPFMSSKAMNNQVKSFLKDNYADVKSDLFSAFIVRNLELALPKGQVGFVTPFVWMFLSSYEKLRRFLLSKKTICNLVKPSYTSFFASAIVPLVTFVVKNGVEDLKGDYIDLGYLGSAESQPIKLKAAIDNPDCGYFYRASAADFKKIPGSPIAYWLSISYLACFGKQILNDHMVSEGAVKTGNNARFIRFLWEVNRNQVGSNNKWRKHPKGGDFRKWYGNLECVVDWSDSARKHYRDDPIARIPVESIWDMRGITWTAISSSALSFRIEDSDEIANNAALFIYPKEENRLIFCLCCLNANPTNEFLKAISPTLNYLVGDVLNIPFPTVNDGFDWNDTIGLNLIHYSKTDWDSYETSWDFTTLPLLRPDHRRDTLADTYAALRCHWQDMTADMQRLEEENNRIFIDAYGLQEELTPEVPLGEITLTCNPHYRYGGKKSEKQREALLLADTMRELVSYAVGCMFGRYSLDQPGLILANQGDTAAAYRTQVPNPSFPPDEDNVIPILDEGWFTDDIAERFKAFLRLTFGETHYAGNLAFLEKALGRDIRSYFLRDFYDDHLQTYKKRPIYWLFSSPNGSFNALIYMHRYRPDTLSVILNDYLRQYRDKLSAHKAHLEQVSLSGSQRDKTQALKEIDRFNKILAELKEYEDEILYPLATERLQIDLDDGVKVNYPKFGRALRKI